MSNFEKIAGYEAEKKELEVLVDIFNNRQKYLDKGATLPKGLVVSGEGGMGKKLFLEVFAAACNMKIRRVDSAGALDGQDLFHRIRKAFIKGARSTEPSVIFIADIDKFLFGPQEALYDSRSAALLGQLNELLDGIERFGHVFFVITCKDHTLLPQSLLQTGRFDKSISLGFPTHPMRTAILQTYMDASSCSFSLTAEEIAGLTSGFSCAKLKVLVGECVFSSDGENRVEEALIREKVTQLESDVSVYDNADAGKIVQAVRNTGAFLVARDYNKGDYVLSLKEPTVSNCFLQGVLEEFGANDYWDDYEDDDDEDSCRPQINSGNPYSKNDFLAAITALLGGYAAEEIVLHKVHHTNAPGMRIINRILLRMAECGMLGLNLMYFDMRWREIPYSATFSERMDRAFEQTLEKCYTRAREIVVKNEQLIKRLAVVLSERGSLEKRECEEAIFEFGGIA